jgi:SAM-dependent methyltransferase
LTIAAPQVSTSAYEQPLDASRIEAFAETLFGFYTGGMLSYLVDIGHTSGLFDAATAGPATSGVLAVRAGLHERYVREWLGAMVTGGIFRYEPSTGTYWLPAEHAVCLTGDTSSNLAPFSLLTTHLAKHVGQVTTAFRDGGGVPYEAFRPEFTDVMDALNRGGFDEQLVSTWLDLVPGLRDRLTAGARVADIACGTGHAMVLLGQAFPASSFVGYDIAEEAIAAGRREAAEHAVDNVTFEVRDAASLTVDELFEVVFVFDAIHDQVAPADVLVSIHDMLTADGLLLAFEPHASSNLEDNVAHPLAPFLYAISTLHCLTISLAHDGAGLGTVWGEQVAREMLRDAGFSRVTVCEVPDEPVNALYVAHR